MALSNDSGRGRSAFAPALICAVFPVADTRPAQAGMNIWTSRGPPGGDVRAFAIYPIVPIMPFMPSMLYAATFGTDDCGASFGLEPG